MMAEMTEETIAEGTHCACGAMFMNGAWWTRIGSGLGHAHTPRGPLLRRG